MVSNGFGVTACRMLHFFDVEGRWAIVVFFFQAEDGIRDLVRSRGLGDVYKRQTYLVPVVFAAREPMRPIRDQAGL